MPPISSCGTQELWVLFFAIGLELITGPWGAFCGHGWEGGCSGDLSELLPVVVEDRAFPCPLLTPALLSGMTPGVMQNHGVSPSNFQQKELLPALAMITQNTNLALRIFAPSLIH